jgi:type IV secretion system protein VirB3
VPGFEVVLHRSLTEPILLAGAPRSIAILNGTVAAAIGLGLRLWLAGLLLCLAGHAVAAWLTRHDPAFLTVLSRHTRHKGALSC